MAFIIVKYSIMVPRVLFYRQNLNNVHVHALIMHSRCHILLR